MSALLQAYEEGQAASEIVDKFTLGQKVYERKRRRVDKLRASERLKRRHFFCTLFIVAVLNKKLIFFTIFLVKHISQNVNDMHEKLINIISDR